MFLNDEISRHPTSVSVQILLYIELRVFSSSFEFPILQTISISPVQNIRITSKHAVPEERHCPESRFR